jgi:hypothetical protein
VDVAAAVQALDEVDRALQTKGWHWNREEELGADPGRQRRDRPPRELPVGGQRLLARQCHPVRVSERARKLYNRDDHSFTFTAR